MNLRGSLDGPQRLQAAREVSSHQPLRRCGTAGLAGRSPFRTLHAKHPLQAEPEQLAGGGLGAVGARGRGRERGLGAQRGGRRTTSAAAIARQLVRLAQEQAAGAGGRAHFLLHVRWG